MQNAELVSVSDTLSEIRRKMADRLRVYTADYFREHIPELNELDVTDDMITRCPPLIDIIGQKRSCSGCQGFQQCTRPEGMKGFWHKLMVDRRDERSYLDTYLVQCDPFKAHLKELEWRKLQEFSGKASTDAEFTFGNYPAEQRESYPQTFQEAMDFANRFEPPEEGQPISPEFRKGLYLFGLPGVAKTHLVLAICNRLEERRVPVLFVRAESIFDKMRGMLEQKQDIEPILEQYCRVPVLIIDELAQETPPTEFTIGKVFRIVNTRFIEGLPTFFTSNYAPTDVYKNASAKVQAAAAEKIEAIRSRLIKMSKHSHLQGRDGRKIGITFLDAPKGGKRQ
ncbi:AFG1/ZapE family ATPase [Paenibacillus naphthalenovorans]|uniref:AFG1/ZapE family ATPase n=1 Tax=Paenibacillus naphthalenovorans TaxID=162209 RepID=UPI00088E0B7F|nr:AFG1/ZapE family ATPase [Paenibacillus naphthalenovorans]SDI49811.1 primosomal protein DnaI [Paenibacillus naphthalenovorans]